MTGTTTTLKAMVLAAIAIAVTAAAVACGGDNVVRTPDGVEPARGRSTSWEWEPARFEDDSSWQLASPQSGGVLYSAPSPQAAPSPSVAPLTFSTTSAADSASSTLGFAVGGANDINAFRLNIENDFLPLPSSITHQGLYYDYLFDTGQQGTCEQLFCPSYTSAVSPAPLTGDDEYFLSVGLNSGIQQSDFARKKLNVVLVLDISGSMDGSFDRYYYDNYLSGDGEEDDAAWNKSKLDVAKEAAIALLGHLNEGDRFGMVLFESSSYLAAPLGRADADGLREVEDGIREVRTQGGTNIEAGIRTATEQFDEYLDADPAEYSNRIILLTDAQPNTGDTSESGLLGMTRSNAENGISTTMIGIGLDFNTDLTEAIANVRGANYYAVHSPSEFVSRLDEQFEYMVTPLVFDLELNLESSGYEIQAVYGSPDADAATGELLQINTLFPSENSARGTRGGLVLLQLRRLDSGTASLRLTTSYEDVNGNEGGGTADVVFAEERGTYSNTGIRKGILLSRYVNLMRSWLVSEREVPEEVDVGFVTPQPDGEFTIPVVPHEFITPLLSRWERMSTPLSVSDRYRTVITSFASHFAEEMAAIGDEELQQDLDILEQLREFTG